MARVHGRPPGGQAVRSLVGPLVVLLAVWNNVVVPRLPGRPGVYEGANGTATAVLLGVAGAAGLSPAELGLARDRLRAGAAWGAAAAAVVASGLAAGLAVPSLRPLLRDARVAGLDDGAVAYRALVRIPVGTVLWEEVAFRGVLLAALSRLLPRAGAVGVSAAVFGLWHVRPTLGALAANDLADGPLARAGAVLLACLGTAAAGGLFAELRERSDSLIAPALLHLATNSLGLLAAAAAHRLG
jgi:membrane protease YdiL (CAAX protease family)